MKPPSYMKLFKNGELKKRVEVFKNMLKNCVLCPHQCEVNRLKGEAGYCRTLEKVVISGSAAHFGEEPELVGDNGSGTIFFSHCNMKCVFCQNYEISHCGEGEEINSHQLANTMLSLQKNGCHNINLVSPSHIVPQIVEAIYIAAEKGLELPIIYNSNGYDLTDTIKLLEGIIDIYMPDIKFSDDLLGEKYLGVKNYYRITTNAVKEMFRQVGNLKLDDDGIAYKGLLIRHLVMPQNLAGTEKIMEFIATELSKETYVNIMPQYSPEFKAFYYKELSEGITNNEFNKALEIAQKAGLTNI